MLLILTGSGDDPTILKLTATLVERGADVVVVDTTTLERGRISLPLTIHLPAPGRRVAADDIDTAFLWRATTPSPLEPRMAPIVEDREALRFAIGQWSKLSRGLWHALEHHGVRCVNPATATAMWEDKITQLMVADEVGLATPETIYTCDLAEAADFADTHGGRIVYKPLTAYLGGPRVEGHITELYSQVIPSAELRAQAGGCAVATPGIFQPYVEKAYELRIVHIGGELFSCRIESQRSEVAREDWRRYDMANTPHLAHDLDPVVAAQLRELMKRMDLDFGSLDLIVTPEGEHVFLEVNPVGQFDWVAAETGLPIYQRLASFLMGAE